MFWQLAIVRAVAGTLSLWGRNRLTRISFLIKFGFVYLAVYISFIDGRFVINYTIASTDESWTFISAVIGFFIFEELTLIYFDVKYHTFSKELHLHHFLGFTGYFLAGYYNLGHFYSTRAFVLEGSTPFSCICWCLLKLKLERTKIWKINQWILIYVFHLRSVYEFWWLYDIYRDWDQIKQNVPWICIINMLAGVIVVSFWLTPYWTYKKTAQFFNPIDWNAEKDKEKKQDKIDKTS